MKPYVKPLHLQCDCGADCVTLDFDITPDFPDGYISFSTWWSQNRPWRERFKAVWTILRGKSHYFSEVILTSEQTQEIKDYINKL